MPSAFPSSLRSQQDKKENQEYRNKGKRQKADAHKGFTFVNKHYEAIHTLDFTYAIRDVQEVCRTNGGLL